MIDRLIAMLTTSEGRYSRLQKTLHWSVVFLLPLQVWTSGGIERSHIDHMAGVAPARLDLILHEIHTFSGLAILSLVALRVALRLTMGRSNAPPDVSQMVRRLAVANHALLYAVLLALPVTGVAARYLDFGTFGPIHVILTRVLLGLVVLHIAAALWHGFLKRDSVLGRMLPG